VLRKDGIKKVMHFSKLLFMANVKDLSHQKWN